MLGIKKKQAQKNVEAQEEGEKDKFKLFMGARVMWPPDCQDDIL